MNHVSCHLPYDYKWCFWSFWCLPVCLSFTNNLNKWKWSWCRRKKRKTLSISVWPNFCTCDEVYFQHFRIRYLCYNREKAPQRQICLSFTYLLYVIAIILLLLYFLFKERRTFDNQKLTLLVTSSRSTPLTARRTFVYNSEKNGIEPIPPFIADQLSRGVNECDIVCVWFLNGYLD